MLLLHCLKNVKINVVINIDTQAGSQPARQAANQKVRIAGQLMSKDPTLVLNPTPIPPT